MGHRNTGDVVATKKPTAKNRAAKSAPAEVPVVKVCVLRSADRDRKSHGGFVWPASGPIECPDWKAEKECGNGLHGLLWGIGDWSLCRTTDPTAVWQVVEVDAATLIDLEGKVKFPRGEVIYSGTLAGALTLTAGRHFETLKAKAEKDGAATTGYGAPAATTGYGAPAATTGNRAPAATTGEYAPAATTGEYAPAATTGYGAPAATTGNRAPAACIGLNGRAKAGLNSSIILTYADAADRIRHVVGYVGEDGIEAGVWYEATTAGKLVRAASQADPTAA